MTGARPATRKPLVPSSRPTASRATEKGRARVALGRRAEDVAADYLFADGFTILERNLRFGKRELDIVAQRGALLAVVEVRTRGPGAFAKPFASITREKRRHLLVASAQLHRRLGVARPDIERLRIDVAAVSFDQAGASIAYAAGAIVRGAGDPA